MSVELTPRENRKFRKKQNLPNFASQSVEASNQRLTKPAATSSPRSPVNLKVGFPVHGYYQTRRYNGGQ